ncbi:MAG: 2-hydroxychromene-2-carboxylate isomerase [Qingshengfaniella sp.]
MTQIDYYFSTLSPFIYLAGTRLEQIAARHGAEIAYKPLDLLQLFPRTGGTHPAERAPCRMDYARQEMRRWAKKLDLPLSKPAFFPVNSAPSSYAIIAAQNAGGGDLGALVHGIVRACWVEGRNISEDAVIRDCLSQAGFDPGLADSGLLTGAETYAANLEEAVARGVFGVPFYVVGEEKFWGQDRLDMLDDYLAERG